MPETYAVILPSNVKPTRYRLTLEPDLTDFTFSGEEAVDIDILEATDEITLNSAEIDVRRCRLAVEGKEALEPSDISFDAEGETVTFRFGQPVGEGPARLDISSTTGCGASTEATTRTSTAMSSTWPLRSSRPRTLVALFHAGTSPR